MKAARIAVYGHADVIEIADISQPVPRQGQVLIEVHAASINPFDTTVREGRVAGMIPGGLPVTLGGDLAGIVREVGEGVTALAAGDQVYGQAAVVAGNSGAFAEYAVTAADQLAKMPAGLSFTDAAALPLTGVSALQALTEHIGLSAGRKIFILGGAGGIGTMAIQLAKHLGAHVATTATGSGLDYVRGLGADEVVDYQSQDFASLLHGYDAVFDTVGGDTFGRSLAVLKRGGIAVSMIAEADPDQLEQLGVVALLQQTKVNTERLSHLRQFVESGALKVHVDQIFPLDQVSKAFAARESGQVRGKVVIQIHD